MKAESMQLYMILITQNYQGVPFESWWFKPSVFAEFPAMEC